MNIEDLVSDVRRVTRSARKQLEQVGFESLSSEVGDLNIAFAELAARLIRTEEAYLVEIVRSAGWLSAGAVHALGDLGPAGPSVDLFTSRRLDPSDRWLVLAEALVAKGGLRRTLRVSDGSVNSEPGQLSSLLRKLMEGEPPSADDAALQVGYEVPALEKVP